MKLSILMAVHNEASTVREAVKRVFDTEFPCDVELVVVDDGSTDETSEVLESLNYANLAVHRHAANSGKGAAIATALRHATGDYVVPCDADLECNPEELPGLLAPVVSGDATVVYGIRSFLSQTAFSFWYVMGNKLITLFANLLFNSWIHDLETCFKLMPSDLFRSLDIRSSGFGMEAEVTGKLLRRGHTIYEIPISYKARQRDKGKKIKWTDGAQALWILVKIRLASRAP